jgi:hypothetical protein
MLGNRFVPTELENLAEVRLQAATVGGPVS